MRFHSIIIIIIIRELGKSIKESVAKFLLLHTGYQKVVMDLKRLDIKWFL